jgi:hypothetical protein
MDIQWFNNTNEKKVQLSSPDFALNAWIILQLKNGTPLADVKVAISWENGDPPMEADFKQSDAGNGWTQFQCPATATNGTCTISQTPVLRHTLTTTIAVGVGNTPTPIPVPSLPSDPQNPISQITNDTGAVADNIVNDTGALADNTLKTATTTETTLKWVLIGLGVAVVIFLIMFAAGKGGHGVNVNGVGVQ